MVTLQTAENALKTLYLGVVSDQLNINTNPLFSKIEQTTSDVWGKEIVKLAPYGLNGGFGAGTETGALPSPRENNYAQMRTTLKNLYGTIELSDKAIRASQNNAGAFVNLLNAEMEGLLKACKFNFSRMLFGDGSGDLATIDSEDANHQIDDDHLNIICVRSVKNLMEGMVVDIMTPTLTGDAYKGFRILSIDRKNRLIMVEKEKMNNVSGSYHIFVQGSFKNEITGLGAVFSDSGTLYGLNRTEHAWLNPLNKAVNAHFSLSMMQEAIDSVEENAGSQINYITCSYDIRRKMLEALETNRVNMDYMNLEGGFKALSYNGIPVVADRFLENEMYFLNTDEFKLHQLCDWRWLEGENGNILKQNLNTPTYKATLVKYCDLICDKPMGQAKLYNFQ